MGGGSVDGVQTNRIGTQLLQVGKIAFPDRTVLIRKQIHRVGVQVPRVGTWIIVDSSHNEFVAGLTVKELVMVNLDRRERRHGGRQKDATEEKVSHVCCGHVKCYVVVEKRVRRVP